MTTTTNPNETASSIAAAAKWSLPRILLHLEGAAVFVVSLALYAHLQGNGWLLLLLILSPDVSMVGYALNPLWGARLYNGVHNYALPLTLGGIAILTGWQVGMLLALIWTAHIGMDRMLGYGLKYPTQFKDTHLGRV